MVRDRCLAALKEREPPLPDEVKRRIARYRANFDNLADENLPLDILDQLAWLGEMIASHIMLDFFADNGRWAPPLL